jgi:hypothetical protein
MLAGYPRLPFDANMFAAADYPIESGAISDALAEQLVVQGDEEAVVRRPSALLDSGLGELLLTIVPLGDVAATRTRPFRRLPVLITILDG